MRGGVVEIPGPASRFVGRAAPARGLARERRPDRSGPVDHADQDSPGAEHDPTNIHFPGPPPLVRIDLPEWAGRPEVASIVDEQIDRPELALDGRRHSVDR